MFSTALHAYVFYVAAGELVGAFDVLTTVKPPKKDRQ